MAAQTAARREPSSLSSLATPPSPTLTNPDMILPDMHGDAAYAPLSPPYQSENPPSPNTYMRTLGGQTRLDSGLARSLSKSASLRHLALNGVLSPVSEDGELEGDQRHASGTRTPRNERALDSTLASSPTLRATPPPIEDSDLDDTSPAEYRQRRSSDSSGSVKSSDIEKLMWSRYESSNSRCSRPTTSRRSGSPKDADHGVHESEDDFEAESDGWEEDADADERDAASSAALSRRAEIILANAKQRLMLMEGNLKGARHSLMVSPSLSLRALKSASELSNQVANARARDRQLYRGYGGQGQSWSPSLRGGPPPASGNANHSRVISENFIPSTGPTAVISGPMARQTLRSVSALGNLGGGTHFRLDSPSVRTSRSSDAIRLRMSPTSVDDAEQIQDGRSLDPLVEDGSLEASEERADATKALKEQMNQLRGRISSLQKRAKEDSLRRRSLQSLRTPSPFTAAEIWYTGAEGYKSSPLGTERKNGLSGEKTRGLPDWHRGTSPLANPVNRESVSTFQGTEFEDNEPSDVTEGAGDGMESSDSEHPFKYDKEVAAVDERIQIDGSPSQWHRDGGEDADGESIYEQAVDEPLSSSPPDVQSSRHEDRPDAFDYQHFFLHSTMGTYTRSEGSSSPSPTSTDSGDTTKPAGPGSEDDEADDELNGASAGSLRDRYRAGLIGDRQLAPSPDIVVGRSRSAPYRATRGNYQVMHGRTGSVDTVSSVATFQTANESRSASFDASMVGVDEGSEDDTAVNRAMGLGHWQQSQPVHGAVISGEQPQFLHVEDSEDSLSSEASTPLGPPQSQTAKRSSTSDRPRPSSAGATVMLSGRASSSDDLGRSANTWRGTLSADVAAFLDPNSPAAAEALQGLSDKDKMLVLSVSGCLLRTCEELRGEQGRRYDARVWRRRLDGARRLLRGMELGKGEQ